MKSLQQGDIKVKNLVIIGYGSQGRMLKNVVEQFDLGYRFLGFLDDKVLKPKTLHDGFEAPLSYSRLLANEDVYFILAIGNVEARFVVEKRLGIPSNRYATIVHPRAYVDKTAELGAGSYVSAHATVMHGTKIGNHTTLLSNSVVEYESTISSFVNISPNATLCGNVRIQDRTFIGAGATIIQGLSVGGNSIVGAGATVIKDVPSYSLAIGVPATCHSRKKGHSFIQSL
ncbi:acetyltransferase [Listeria sp. PSOL-1]|uniref:acetyltransferase n=1 Tax=Listeria sp. PSOL-1 TaxID=1844999 RepID=UPI0013D54132|nr:acetyltransferase [Listeria sp. PSOL-1]